MSSQPARVAILARRPAVAVGALVTAAAIGTAAAVPVERQAERFPAPEVTTAADAAILPVNELPVGQPPLTPARVAELQGRADLSAPASDADAARRAVWERLADCESGDWHDGQPLADSRRWDYGLTFSHGDIFEGGLNFHPATWDAFRDADMPGHAGRARPDEQIRVGERVLEAQGWAAWPVCSRKLGLRD